MFGYSCWLGFATPIIAHQLGTETSLFILLGLNVSNRSNWLHVFYANDAKLIYSARTNNPWNTVCLFIEQIMPNRRSPGMLPKQLSLIWTSSWSKPGSNMLAYIDPSARHSIQPLEQTTCKNIGMHVKVACCLLLYCKSWFFMQYQILKNLYASQIKTTNVNARLKNPLIFVTCKRLMHSHMVLIDRRPLQP